MNSDSLNENTNMRGSRRYSSKEELVPSDLQALEAKEYELRAIEEGIDSVERGDEGVALDQAFEKLREKHRI